MATVKRLLSTKQRRPYHAGMRVLFILSSLTSIVMAAGAGNHWH